MFIKVSRCIIKYNDDAKDRKWVHTISSSYNSYQVPSIK